MFSTEGERTGRTPRLDAPPYDPSLWEGRDCAFLTTLKDVFHEQQRRERHFFAETLDGSVSSASLPTALYPRLVTRLSTCWRNLLAWLLPSYYAQHVLATPSLAHMSNDELVSRMHLALQAGDTDVSALIAKELARRRVRLYEEEEEEVVGRGGSGKYVFGRGNRLGASSGMPIGLSTGSGIPLRGGDARSSTNFSTDSSFTVPDILLQRRSRRSAGDGGGSLRF